MNIYRVTYDRPMFPSDGVTRSIKRARDERSAKEYTRKSARGSIRILAVDLIAEVE
jgi:hypothetical protein